MNVVEQEAGQQANAPNARPLLSPKNVTFSTPIQCSSCGEYMGTWAELERDFVAQGGLDGIFEMDRGEIIKIDDDLPPRHANQNDGKA